MNARGECRRIGIVAGADHDPGMGSLRFLIQADEVETVQGENHAVLFRSVGQNLIIGDFLVCTSGLIGCENVMTEATEFLDHTFGEVLVGVE